MDRKININVIKDFIAIILINLGIILFTVTVSVIAFKLHYLIGMVWIATLLYYIGYKLISWKL